MDRSLSQLMQVLRVASARDVRLARLSATLSVRGPESLDSSAGSTCCYAISTAAATVVDEGEAARLQRAGAVSLDGWRRPHATDVLEALWAQVRRAARTLYGERCRVVSSYGDDGFWRASVVGPQLPRDAADALAIYFAAEGDDECGVLLEVAAFVSALRAESP